MEQIGSISDAAPPGEAAMDAEISVAPAAHDITAAELPAVCALPRFLEARRAAASQIIEDHAGNRLLNSVFNDRGRFLIGMFVQYLHHVRLDGETEAGLTVGRLRALCVKTGTSSPGRATAMLGLMRLSGYVTAAPRPRDGRQRVFVPTQRLVALQRRRWSRHLAALSLIMPEGRAGLDRIGDPVFEAALLRHMAGGIVEGFRFGHYVPELASYFERTAALIILVQLAELVSASAPKSAAPTSISRLAGQFGVARAQARKILDDAAADGFIRRASGSREPIVVLPALTEAVSRFFAASFLYTAHCVRLALAETANIL
jgi:hypothetical protein